MHEIFKGQCKTLKKIYISTKLPVVLQVYYETNISYRCFSHYYCLYKPGILLLAQHIFLRLSVWNLVLPYFPYISRAEYETARAQQIKWRIMVCRLLIKSSSGIWRVWISFKILCCGHWEICCYFSQF